MFERYRVAWIVITVLLIVWLFSLVECEASKRYLAECTVNCHQTKTRADWDEYLPKSPPVTKTIPGTGANVYVLIIDGNRFLVNKAGGIIRY